MNETTVLHRLLSCLQKEPDKKTEEKKKDADKMEKQNNTKVQHSAQTQKETFSNQTEELQMKVRVSGLQRFITYAGCLAHKQLCALFFPHVLKCSLVKNLHNWYSDSNKVIQQKVGPNRIHLDQFESSHSGTGAIKPKPILRGRPINQPMCATSKIISYCPSSLTIN